MQRKNGLLHGLFDSGSPFLLYLILILILLSDQTVIGRQIDNFSGGINTVRSLTDALTNTLYSLRQAVEVPLALKQR
jgi:hypothetical protein